MRTDPKSGHTRLVQHYGINYVATQYPTTVFNSNSNSKLYFHNNTSKSKYNKTYSTAKRKGSYGGEGWKAKKGPIIAFPFQCLITNKTSLFKKQTNKQTNETTTRQDKGQCSKKINHNLKLAFSGNVCEMLKHILKF